ncbi:MAG: formate dehydrogenase accessory sulfurtransferase FdhD [Sphingomonas sp.]|uniref:formate dehydrogenase accessory sulfurtransferase FdhD n=1 Tax=Sphingomonas sp. TaxID=28214 RepID=UPI001AC40382|nr:formate dehydrogenase accessory sulfurtransferase FdhD [Sphingomonas sp.]MBN8847038.1 formate dehydrogenase accessory sulfurtransferase FdhD [Sphingomonas sp.]
MSDPGSIDTHFRRLLASGGAASVARAVAVERPVAIEFNGIGYAVMMATPADLADFATGFAFTERLVTRADQIRAIDHVAREEGDLLRVTLAAECAGAVAERARHRIAESSCGLCGIENLTQAIRPLPPVEAAPRAQPAAIFRALAALRAHQPLNRETGAVHAAARCSADGAVLAVREDVGRHNAFDKLIGAMLREGAEWDGGFALLSSRCSYELVEKAALARCPQLVTISAPTSLAIERARACGLKLTVLARLDAMLEPEA